MSDQVRKWDERFARGDELHDYQPSPPLPAAVAGVTPGLALDLASGAGRHAIWLAERGWRVEAIDGSRTGLERMMDEARRRGIAEQIDPRIPWLYDFKLDFRFR